MPIAAAPLLAVALSATASLEVAIRSEMKGLAGGPPDARLSEPVPYELDPSVSLEIEGARRYAVRLGFASRILFLSVPGSDAAHYGTGAAQVSWRPGDRLRLNLSGTLSRGILETTPTAQLPAFTTSGGDTPLRNVPVVGTAHQHAESVYAAAGYNLSASSALNVAASYSRAGGLDEDARRLLPPEEGERVEASLASGLSPRDTLTFRTGYRRTVVLYFGTGDILDLGVRWDRRLSPGVGAYLGAGFGVTVRSTLVGELPLPLFPGRIAPELEAGIGTPLGTPDLTASFGAAFAPYVDPYSGSVQKRVTARGELDWQAMQRMRISGRLLGASTMTGFLPRGGSAASELVVWLRQPDLELGVGTRVGHNDVPYASYWQWSLFFSIREVSRTSL